MAKLYKNNKDFKIIELNFTEAIVTCEFGFVWDLVCDNCNEYLTSDVPIYYIAVLNRCFCKECLEEWLNRDTTKHYNEDKTFEDKYFNAYKSRLIEVEQWQEEPSNPE